MDLRELEKAVRTLMGSNSPQSALAAAAGNGQASIQIPAEFVDAAKSLLGRRKEIGQDSIMSASTHYWT